MQVEISKGNSSFPRLDIKSKALCELHRIITGQQEAAAKHLSLKLKDGAIYLHEVKFVRPDRRPGQEQARAEPQYIGDAVRVKIDIQQHAQLITQLAYEVSDFRQLSIYDAFKGWSRGVDVARDQTVGTIGMLLFMVCANKKQVFDPFLARYANENGCSPIDYDKMMNMLYALMMLSTPTSLGSWLSNVMVASPENARIGLSLGDVTPQGKVIRGVSFGASSFMLPADRIMGNYFGPRRRETQMTEFADINLGAMDE